MSHCPGCIRCINPDYHGTVLRSCPGVVCEKCAEKDKELSAIKEFNAELAARRFAVRDGYTIIDFLKLWLQQSRDENARKDAEIAKLTAERDALAAAMPSEGADAALHYAAMRTERDSLRTALLRCAEALDDELCTCYDEYQRPMGTFPCKRCQALADPVVVKVRALEGK